MNILKKVFLVLAAGLPFAISAQQINVTENLENIGEGINNALVVQIPETSRNDIISAWKKLMKGSDGKVSGKSEMMTDNAKIPAISPDTVDIYTNFEQKDGYVKMVAAFKISRGFLSSSSAPVEYKEAERIVRNFAVEQARSVVESRLSDDKSKLSKLERKFSDLEEENNNLTKDIENYNKRIEQAQKQIQDNIKTKEKLSKDIESAQKTVEKTQEKLQGIR